MARYTYNDGLVSETIDKLGSALDALNKTNMEIEKGFDLINSARGIESIQVEYTGEVIGYKSLIQTYSQQVLEYKSLVGEYIDDMIVTIQEKAQEIEEYESSPWWLKTFSTIGMGALKLVEGLVGSAENIIDGGATLVGFVGGLFSSEFQDSVGEFIEKDWVGDTTSSWYEDGWLKNVNKYSIMSHESTAANIFKGIGNASGYFALSFIPYVGPIISAVASGIGGVGSGTQAGLQEGKSFNEAAFQGLKEGLIDAGITLVATGAAKAIGGIFKSVTAADDVGKAVISATDDVIKAGTNTIDDGINIATKTANTFDDTTKVISNVAGTLDDGINVSTKVVATLDDAGKVASKGASTIDDGIKAGNIIDDAANVIDDTAKTSSKLPKKNVVSNLINTAKNTINKYPKTALVASTATLVGRKVNDARELSANRIELDSTITPGAELVEIITEKSQIANDGAVINENTGNNGNSIVQSTSPANGNKVSNNETETNYSPTIQSSEKQVSYATTIPEVSKEIEITSPTNTNTESTLQNNHLTPGILLEESIESPTTQVQATNTIVGSVGSLLDNKNNSTLANTFAQDSNLSDVLDDDRNIIIPRSSSPTVMSKINSSNNIITIGAGIGAATIGGLGTKNILDIQDRKKEDKKTLVAKIWQKDKDKSNDNIPPIKEVDRDYISPMDMDAFEN